MWFSYSDLVKKEFVKFYQNLFQNTKLWSNSNISILDLSQDKILVTEDYAYQGETYPVIIVGAEGGSLLVRDLSDDMGSYSYEEQLGLIARQYCTIGKTDSGTASAAVSFIPSKDFALEQVNLMLANSGLYSQGDLTVNLYQDSISGSLLASGSIYGFGDTQQKLLEVGFNTVVNVSADNTYWITVDADDESSYYGYVDDVGITDRDVALKGSSSGSWVIGDDQALVGWIRADSATIWGGDAKIAISLQIAARDEKTANDIADICLIHTELAKKVGYSKFQNSRIRIESIAFGGDVAPLKPGTNTNIFVKKITLNVIAAWSYEVNRDVLKEFGYNINVI